MEPSQFISRADIDAAYNKLYEENEQLKTTNYHVLLEQYRTKICELIDQINGWSETARISFMDGRNNAIAEREQEMCEWVPEDEDSNWYGSQCGMSFVFEDGGAVHNGFNFCPKCGKKLKEIPWDNDEDDAE